MEERDIQAPYHNGPGSDLVSISRADSHQLKKYTGKYWLSEQDLMAALKPLSEQPGVFRPSEMEMAVPVLAQNQFAQDSQSLLVQFEGSNQKLAFFVVNEKKETGYHWQLHCWVKDKGGRTKQLEPYIPTEDGRCGDRVIAKAYQLGKIHMGNNIVLPALKLYKNAPNDSNERTLQNYESVRDQTIHLIRVTVPEHEAQAGLLKNDQEYKDWHRTVVSVENVDAVAEIEKRAKDSHDQDNKGIDYHETRLSVLGVFKTDQAIQAMEKEKPGKSNYDDWLQEQEERYEELQRLALTPTNGNS